MTQQFITTVVVYIPSSIGSYIVIRSLCCWRCSRQWTWSCSRHVMQRPYEGTDLRNHSSYVLLVCNRERMICRKERGEISNTTCSLQLKCFLPQHLWLWLTAPTSLTAAEQGFCQSWGSLHLYVVVLLMMMVVVGHDDDEEEDCYCY